MTWTRNPLLLIPEDRLAVAATRRVWIGVAAVMLGVTACQQGWGGGTYTFVGAIMGGMHLLIFSLLARRWRRERGLWMLYALCTACALFMYTLTLQAPALPWGLAASSTPPLPPPHPRIVAQACDATLGGWLFFLSVRLQISAAVANVLRFRTTRANAAPPPA